MGFRHHRYLVVADSNLTAGKKVEPIEVVEPADLKVIGIRSNFFKHSCKNLDLRNNFLSTFSSSFWIKVDINYLTPAKFFRLKKPTKSVKRIDFEQKTFEGVGGNNF